MGGGGVVKTSLRVQIMLKLNNKLTKLTRLIQIHLPIPMLILILIGICMSLQYCISIVFNKNIQTYIGIGKTQITLYRYQ